MATAYLSDATSIAGHVQLARTTYTDSPFGVLWDRRHSYGADLTYAPSARWNLFADVGFERMRYEQGARTWTAPVPASASNPFNPTPGFASNSNWTATPLDDYYSAGLGFEVLLAREKLRLHTQYTYSRSDGREDFASPLGVAADDLNPFVPQPFTEVDDTEWHTLNPELDYTPSDHLALSAGWHYEKWRINDYTYDGFTYVTNFQTLFPFPPLPLGLAMETGGLLPPPYRTNVFYVRIKVGF
jgi:hypothetical protein